MEKLENMQKFKCSVCGKETHVSMDEDIFHHPMCCGKKMFSAS